MNNIFTTYVLLIEILCMYDTLTKSWKMEVAYLQVGSLNI